METRATRSRRSASQSVDSDVVLPSHGVVTAEQMRGMFETQKNDIETMIHEQIDGLANLTLEANHDLRVPQTSPGFIGRMIGIVHPTSARPQCITYASAAKSSQENSELVEVLKHHNSTLMRDISIQQGSYDELQMVNEELAQKNEVLHNELLESRNGHTQTRKELSTERAMNGELRKKIASLRTMLVPSSSTQVIDSEVKQKFTDLRNLVLRLVKSTWESEFKTVQKQDVTEAQTAMFKRFANNSLDCKYMHNRMRAQIFRIVDKNILSRRHYGLVSEFEVLDRSLGEAEDFMSKNIAGGFENMSEWRLSTMKLTDSHRALTNNISRITQVEIWGLFSIVQTKGKSAEQKGIKLLEQLCDQAFALSLLMRNSEDVFEVEQVRGGGHCCVQEYEALVEAESNEPADDTHRLGTITSCIFGGLIKRTKNDPTRRIILEKGCYIVYQ